MTAIRTMIAIFATVGGIAAERTWPQVCAVTEETKIVAPPPNVHNQQFGSAVAMSGEWAIVGSRHENTNGQMAGAAFVLRRQNEQWTITQTLHEFEPDVQNRFGWAVGIDGDIAAITSPYADVGEAFNAGVVWIYRLIDETWQLEAKLQAEDPDPADTLGLAVSVSGQRVAAGSSDSDLGVNSGAAYVFKYENAAWTQEQKLLADNGAANDEFGSALSLHGERLIVGARHHDGAGSNAGGAYIFHRSGKWQLEQQLLAPDGAAGDAFGSAVALHGSRAVIGAPERDVPQSAIGAVYVFEFDGTSWSTAAAPIATDAAAGDRFGSAVALQGDTLIVGARTKTLEYYPNDIDALNVGVGYLFQYERGDWTQIHQARERYAQTFSTPIVSLDQVGSSAAISGGWFVLGAPMPSNTGEYGAALFYLVQPPDCDADGVPDVCQVDCNNNLVYDYCEIANGDVADCDLNAVPDECDHGFDYVLDDSTGSNVAGVGGPSCQTGADFIWLNQFHVQPGGQRLTHVGIPWTSFTPHLMPATILVYDDPNNDGHPGDAVLLAVAPAQSFDVFGLLALKSFSIFPIPSTYIGPIGKSFFIGVVMSLPCGVVAACSDNTAPNPQRSWRVNAPYQQANLQQLSNNTSITLHTGKWMLRGVALDCNGNGVPDSCDINSGAVQDLNANGIPDECEIACAGDVNFDWSVNVDDLLLVIGAWGTCPQHPTLCPVDTDDSGGVDEGDLLNVINAWGPCP